MGEYLNTKLFKSISKEEAEKMLKCSMSVERLYKCGEVIFTQNDRPNNIYLLLEGQVIISKYLPSGKRDIILTVKEGQLFGEVFLFSEEDYYWYEAQTMKESRILVMPYAFINGFCSKACDHHKQIIRNLLDIQSEANLNMLKKLHIVKGTTLKQKIALWMLDNMNEDGIVKVEMTREALADYLGTARPSLSRTLAEMQKEGIISVAKKNISILDNNSFEKLFE